MRSVIKIIAMLSIILLINCDLYSQPRPPAPGTSDDTIGGNAPIDGGLSVFMLLCFAYSSYKYRKLKIN